MTNFFLKLVNMSVNASWLILAVIAARLLLKKAPRWISVLLWGLVGLRLICPFTVESTLSLVPKADILSPAVTAPAAAPVQSNVPATGTVTGAVSAPVTGQAAAPVPNISADQNPLQIWLSVLSTVWCAGVAFLLFYAAVSYGQLRRKVRTAVRYQDNVFQSESVASPFILGILQPRIYLPFSLTENEIPSVLAHEKSHLARLDHWWKAVSYLLLTVYWFNPLMWVSYVLLGRDIELACDERVIRKMTSDERAHYSEILLRCSINKSQMTACPLAFGEVGVKERVKTVLHYKKPAFWVTMVAVLACIAVAVCFLTSPKEAKAKQPLLDLNRNGTPEELQRTDGNGHFQTVEIPVVSGIEAVLQHGAQFLYLHDDKESSMELRNVPSFLDPDDDYGLALQTYSLTDLDGDGVSEAVIPVFGIAGDQSRFLVLHEIGEWVYGYFFSYRDFEDLKADGTYHYSDPTGVREQGICRITGFTEKECIIDRFTCGTGTYEGLTEFIVEHRPATEEAFLDALSLQSEKNGATWSNIL